MSISVSTSATLPPGAFFTNIQGLRCTAIPRTDTSFLAIALGTATNVATVFPTLPTLAVATTSTTTTSAANGPPAPTSSSSSSSLPPSPVQVAATSTSSTTAVALSSTPAESPTPSPVATTTTTTKKATTTSTSLTITSQASSSTTAAGAQRPSVNAVSAGPRKDVTAPVTGGVVGGLAFLGLVGFIIFLCLRRRKRRRSSLLTPLTPRPDSMMGQSPKATGLEKVKSQLSSSIVSVGSTLSSLKAKAMGRRNGVNMNRGASPFRERIPQHSRNNSVLSTQSAVGGRERFGDWLGRVKSDLISGLGREKEVEVVDQFSVAREKGASTVPAPLNVGSNLDFSPLAAMEERQRQLAAEERERALASGSQAQNPFADPWPAPASQNPFGDPANVLAPPLPSQPSSSGYFADVFRAARQSNATTIDSRYPSTYAPSRDSYGYRDTYMSSTTNGRRTKGRSDPFDLEKLELDARPGAANQSYLGADRAPRVVSSASSVRSTGTYSSKYTSGVVHEEWGDPGPDLGPGSNTTNSRTNPGPRAGGVLEEGTRGSQRSIGKAL